MVEYARCNEISGETVVKAFDGKTMTKVDVKDSQAQAALRRIQANTGDSQSDE